MKLEKIYEELNALVEKEEKLNSTWPCDSQYNVPTWDKIYDALEIIDSIINYEPSDAELEAYFNDYQDPPHVVNQRMLELKSESHGRRFI
tara:strand:- start:204 stop:473 length:270 start_codon:yes stop_codon:yes gene_type:complete